ncbi:YcxB family protein [Thalassotalea sp. PLHSN55]|uniref:YcxB family protein n=1 Tax=Thalassotalea sp. PLHSN55 TaxID=3435888 RepID=UPI003F86B69E
MNTPFSYTTSYLLDKAHFQECYSQSVPLDRGLKIYTKAALLVLVGLAFLLFSDNDKYVAWFIVALGVLDAVATYYQKPWWVTRQMLGRASGSKVTLTIDEKGIHNQSHYVNNALTWSEISQVESTELGVLIIHAKGKNYISNSVLSKEALAYIVSQSPNEKS